MRKLLCGGGQPANEFILVVVKRGGKRPTLDTGRCLGKAFRPILGSWHLVEINPCLSSLFRKIPLGAYRRGIGRSVNTIVHTRTGKAFNLA